MRKLRLIIRQDTTNHEETEVVDSRFITEIVEVNATYGCIIGGEWLKEESSIPEEKKPSCFDDIPIGFEGECNDKDCKWKQECVKYPPKELDHD